MNVRNDPGKKPALPLNLALFPVLVCLALMVVLYPVPPAHPITLMVFERPEAQEHL